MELTDLTFMALVAGIILLVIGFVLRKVAAGSPAKKDQPLTKKDEKRVQQKEVKNDNVPKVSYGKINLYFGSQTGTASNFCKTLAEEAQSQGFTPNVVDLQEFSADKLKQAQVGIFCLATHGEGEPTDNAVTFLEWLSGEDRTETELNALRYSVFGLGNRQYQFFNGMAKKCNQLFEKLGGERIYQYGEGDDDGSLEDDFNEWKTNLWKTLTEKIKPVETGAKEGSKPNNLTFTITLGGEGMKEVDLETYDIDTDSKDYDFQTKTYLKCKEIQVLKAYELRQNNDEGSTLGLDFNVKGGSIDYKTASNLYIFPENDTQVVEDMAKRLNVNLNQIFAIEENKERESSIKAKYPCPSPISLKTYLTRFCDLQGPVKKSTLKQLAQLAKSSETKEKLLRLASPAGKLEFDTEITKNLKGLYDVLAENDIEVDLQHLIHVAEMMKPRYFTVASSSTRDPDTVHICASLLENKVNGKWRPGVASGHFRRIQEGFIKNPDTVVKARVNIRDSSFYLPKDVNRPLICVGPGAGIAPFRGFFLEKEHSISKGENKIWGDVTFYFGCRKSNSDYIYKEELERLHKEGVINKYYTAFSRETEHRVYVQDVMKQNKDEVMNSLFEQNGLLYICGSIQMGNDVMKLITELAAEHYKISLEEAGLKIKDFEVNDADKRIIKELWE